MIDIEMTFIRMQSVVNTPFRVLTLVIVAVLVVIIVINAN